MVPNLVSRWSWWLVLGDDSKQGVLVRTLGLLESFDGVQDFYTSCFDSLLHGFLDGEPHLGHRA